MSYIKKVFEWLQGRKTYIFSIIVLAYAVGAYLGYLPEPEVAAGVLVVIVGYAVTFRSALRKFFEDVPKQ